MTREEFLSRLRLTLQGKVSSDKVQENISYYNDYIMEEVRKGKSEAEVLQMLGDPSLLAKTIITADDAGKHQQDTVYETDENGSVSRKEKNINTNKWWKKVLLILTIVMVVLLVVAIVSGLVRIFAPIVLPVLVIIIVFRIFKRRQ